MCAFEGESHSTLQKELCAAKNVTVGGVTRPPEV